MLKRKWYWLEIWIYTKEWGTLEMVDIWVNIEDIFLLLENLFKK